MFSLAAALGVWIVSGESLDGDMTRTERIIQAHRWTVLGTPDHLSDIEKAPHFWMLLEELRNTDTRNERETEALYKLFTDCRGRVGDNSDITFWFAILQMRGDKKTLVSLLEPDLTSKDMNRVMAADAFFRSDDSPEVIAWWKQKLQDKASSEALIDVGYDRLLEADMNGSANILLRHRRKRTLVNGEGSATRDTDGDGDADNVDPWPNASGPAKTEREKVMAAAFEAMSRGLESPSVQYLVAPNRFRRFEMPGSSSQTVWVTKRPANVKDGQVLYWLGTKLSPDHRSATFKIGSDERFDFYGQAKKFGTEWLVSGYWANPCGTQGSSYVPVAEAMQPGISEKLRAWLYNKG